MICSLAKETAFAGLKINGGKTKLLSLTGSIDRIVKVVGVQIEAVDRFACLGSIIAAGGGIDMGIEYHIEYHKKYTWKVSKAVTSRLQVFINRCLRIIFRIYWPNRITNEELLQRARIEPVEIRIRRHKRAWIGQPLAQR